MIEYSWLVSMDLFVSIWESVHCHNFDKKWHYNWLNESDRYLVVSLL